VAVRLARYRQKTLLVDYGHHPVVKSARCPDLEPCNSDALTAAPLDNTRVYFALLFHR